MTPIDQTELTRAEAIEFLLEIGRDLHQAGTPAHRLEETLEAIAAQLGMEAQLFSTPTSLLVAIGPIGEQRTHLLRVEPGTVDLERLALVDGVAGRVARGECDPHDGVEQLREIEIRKPRYPRWLSACCFGIASASAAVFFGGGLADLGASALLGMIVGFITIYLADNRRFARVLDASCGVIVAAGALLFDRYVENISVYLVTLSGLIVLIPGLTLTLAVNELATRNLVSGAARVAYAATILVSIAFGVAIGSQIEKILPLGVSDEPDSIAALWKWPVLVLAALAFTILFRARPASFWPIVVMGAIGVACAQLGTSLVGTELGASAGALAIGIGANLWSRFTDEPAAIPTLPGIILLVPGALGFGGIVALVGEDTVLGIEGVFGALLVAVSLVFGLLMANVLVPMRKTL